MIQRIRNGHAIKVVSSTTICSLFAQIFLPITTWAKPMPAPGGPESPEFGSFTPYSSGQLVNPFTGDLNYNLPVIEIPGPHGGGYALSLSYESGVNADSEASWVGLGWSLNPGSINRAVRGIVDDYDGKQITHINQQEPFFSVDGGHHLGLEVFSIGIGIDRYFAINNYSGYQSSWGFGLSALSGGIGLNVNTDFVNAKDPSSWQFKPNVNPMAMFSSIKNETWKPEKSKNQDHAEKEQVTKKEHVINKFAKEGKGSLMANANSSTWMSLNQFGYNPGFTPQEGYRVSGSITFEPTIPPPVGVEVGSNLGMTYKQNKYPIKHKSVYGYIHSSGITSDNVLMDYYYEKESSFSNKSVFLGVPFGNPDQFMVSGEGLGGSFQYYPNKELIFKPEAGESKTKIMKASAEIMAGGDNGGGTHVAKYDAVLAQDGWGAGSNDVVFSPRFHGDLAGRVIYGNNASRDVKRPVDLNTQETVTNASDSWVKHIDFAPEVIDNHANVRSKYIERIQDEDLDEYQITTENGMKYSYGLNVHQRNNKSMSIGLSSGEYDYSVYKNHLAFINTPNTPNTPYDVTQILDFHTLNGTYDNNEFVSEYLLTSIVGNNYVDANADGLVNDGDWGAWTKFDYKQLWGGNDSWYSWRLPYAGLYYDQNQVHTKKDDIGSFSCGEKEVYLLKSVETKTHIAYFVCNESSPSDFGASGFNQEILQGSGDTRYDSHSAVASPAGYENLNSRSFSFKNKSEKTDIDDLDNGIAHGQQKLQYLEKIVLFAKGDDGSVDYGSPLKTVHFEYDYSSFPYTPDNINSAFNFGGKMYPAQDEDDEYKNGKLTLRKVWTEYEGVNSANYSPYEFNYYYPASEEVTLFSAQLGDHSSYQALEEYQGFNRQVENPNYSATSTDQWGTNLYMGDERYEEEKPWINQFASTTNKKYDPAAWHLKWVKLPTGGELYFQYEQDDYRYVQDKIPMNLVKVKEAVEEEGNYYFKVSSTELGLAGQAQTMADKLNKYFEESDEKLYFELMYKLKANKAHMSDDAVNKELITGYAVFKEAVADGIDNVRIYLTKSDYGSKDAFQYPKETCKVFYANNCRLKQADGFKDVFNPADFTSMMSGDAIAIGMGFEKAFSFLNSFASYAEAALEIDKIKVCNTLIKSSSYLKLPMFDRDKKGGGLRVKRVITVDRGNDAVAEGEPGNQNNNGSEEIGIYGTEYIYKLEDGGSSGVALNEPNSTRNQNPLVGFLPSKGQAVWDKMYHGVERNEIEGPVGESVLPSPSVGYSRVITQSIHYGTTNSGHTINEYYTAKDFPAQMLYLNDDEDELFSGGSFRMTSLSGDNNRKVKIPVNLPFVKYNRTTIASSQGFRMILNSMHGQTRKVSHYSGVYTDPLKVMLSSTEYEYFDTNDPIPTWKLDNGNNPVEITNYIPGEVQEVAMAAKRIEDDVFDLSLEVDASIGIFGPLPIPFVTLFPYVNKTESKYGAVTKTKVIKVPSFVKKVKSFENGIYSEVENLAFDYNTGSPILVRTNGAYDGLQLANNQSPHKGSVYSVNIPAHWKYPQMGAKSGDVNNSNQLTTNTGTYKFYGEEPQPSWFTGEGNTLSNVLVSSIQSFKNGWYNSDIADNQGYPDIPVILMDQLNEIWYPESSYIYNANETVSSADKKVYESGYFDISEDFHWSSPENNSEKWVESNRITTYSINGHVLEEQNALNIPSSAFYSSESGQKLPSITAVNSDWTSIHFENFESDDLASENVAHTGHKSRPFEGELNKDLLVNPIKCTQRMKDEGVLVQLWLGYSEELGFEFLPALEVNGTNHVLNLKGRVGIWGLYEVVLDNNQLPAINDYINPVVHVSTGDLFNQEDVYLDDVKIAPYNSESSCYVYDLNNYRLLAQMDEQHFAKHYVYDQKGVLRALKIETENGVKTVRQSHFNVPTITK